MKQFARKFAGTAGLCAVLALLLVATAAPAMAQKNKDKNKVTPQADTPFDAKALLPDTDLIDQTIGEALGYWQIGDVDSLHKYYSDDVMVVSGAWEKPIVGWENYLKSYKSQRARVSTGHLDRSNTYIKVNGNSAWATYQWEYVATVDGQLADYRGHTTLILNKQADHWVIILDHSSIVPDAGPAMPAQTAGTAQPGQS